MVNDQMKRVLKMLGTQIRNVRIVKVGYPRLVKERKEQKIFHAEV